MNQENRTHMVTALQLEPMTQVALLRFTLHSIMIPTPIFQLFTLWAVSIQAIKMTHKILRLSFMMMNTTDIKGVSTQ